jgi:2-polyprenyl-3-methyl-5-hydroxy-6-metoxy-1,4-benzoquinol methylase
MNQKINCPICSTSVDSNNFLESYISPYNKQEYKLYECSNCLLQWWEPLRIIPNFYKDTYFIFHQDLNQKLSDWDRPFFQYFLVKNKLPKNEIQLLDVGCGEGSFLMEIKKRTDFKIWGIDFDKKSIEIAKNKTGTDTIYPMSLEEFYEYAIKNNLNFDIITFFSVLEHQDNPKKFIALIRGMLKPGGYAIGSVPKRESKLLKFYRYPYDDSDMPPHHFLRFNQKSLKYLFSLEGFECSFHPIKLSSLLGLPELMIFSNIVNKFKKILKKVARPDLNEKYPVSLIQDNSTKIKFLKCLRIIKNVILLPIERSMYFYQHLDPPGIYFECKKVC